MDLIDITERSEGLVARLFSYGFRPLFLCTVLSALMVIGWWIAFIEGILPPPNSFLHPVAWHSHEMVFGFAGSAIGGFLLTAVANWTKRPPVHGFQLGTLVVCWILARIVVAYDLGLNPIALMVIDSSYFILLTLLMGREVIVAGNQRNLVIVGILLVFTLLNVTFHLDGIWDLQIDTQQFSIRAMLIVVCIMMSVIGGRIIPAFTGNWLRKTYGMDTPLPVPQNRFDTIVIGATICLAVTWMALPGHWLTGCVAVTAGVLQLLRQLRWQPLRTFKDPLVVVLHVGYAWIGFGFLLLGVGILTAGIPASAGIHSIGIGAMAGLILAVSSRAALGHTNRPLRAGVLASAAFLLINLAALVRVVASIFGLDLLVPAAILWLLAFGLFSLRYAPILIGPSAP